MEVYKPLECPNCGEGAFRILARLKKPISLIFESTMKKNASRLMREFHENLKTFDDGLRVEFCVKCGTLILIPQRVMLH